MPPYTKSDFPLEEETKENEVRKRLSLNEGTEETTEKDKKTFYKTADICQLLVCREGEATEDEEETAAAAAQQKKGKKNDPNKVRKCEDRAMDTSVMGREGYGG